MRFLVYAPGPYDPRGGGCIALHKLAHNIATVHGECFIYTDSVNPEYKGEKVTLQQAALMAMFDSCMVIYPEVTVGNPLEAVNITRWILYHVRDYGQHGVFGEDDLIYKYAPYFKLRHEREADGQLRAVELNLDLWQDKEQPRAGACYLRKKSGREKADIHPDGSLQIDDYPEKGGFEYLVKVFNRCEYFYSYDTATWLSIMAALCGCKSIVVPDPETTAQEWYAGFPYFFYGIAYGVDELERAQSTQPFMREHLRRLEQMTLTETRNFILTAKLKMGIHE
jgi:hypothetical protein